MRPQKPPLTLPIRKVQKHFYRYLKQVGKGACIQICESRRKSDPMAMLVPHDWHKIDQSDEDESHPEPEV